jgi:hypothetical protein
MSPSQRNRQGRLRECFINQDFPLIKRVEVISPLFLLIYSDNLGVLSRIHGIYSGPVPMPGIRHFPSHGLPHSYSTCVLLSANLASEWFNNSKVNDRKWLPNVHGDDNLRP